MKNVSRIFLAFVISAFPLVAAAQSVTVIVNGQTMSFAQPPIVRAGRVFVPLRGIFEQLGASVVYSNGQINATGSGRTISLTIGSTQATVSGQPETMDVAPFIVGATTFVPLRFISQALGAAVNWNDSTSTVTISGRAGGPPHGRLLRRRGPRRDRTRSSSPCRQRERFTPPILRFAFSSTGPCG